MHFMPLIVLFPLFVELIVFSLPALISSFILLYLAHEYLRLLVCLKHIHYANVDDINLGQSSSLKSYARDKTST